MPKFDLPLPLAFAFAHTYSWRFRFRLLDPSEMTNEEIIYWTDAIAKVGYSYWKLFAAQHGAILFCP